MILDADELVPGLWQGSLPAPGSFVRSAGFDVLVLCAREYQLPEDNYPGVQVIHAPNDDHDAYPLDRDKLRVALEAAQQVAQAVRSNLQVLSTCAAGLNRSGLVTGIALHLLYGWSGIKCITHIRMRRPVSRVRPGLQALGNGEFVRALSRLGGSPPELVPSLETKLSALWMPRYGK